jgi:hypothetical protein
MATEKRGFYKYQTERESARGAGQWRAALACTSENMNGRSEKRPVRSDWPAGSSTVVPRSTGFST